MTEIRQGDVYWFDFGAPSGSAPAERHPCVVVQGDIFNATRGTTVVCLITSNPVRAADHGNVPLRRGAGGLPKESIVNVSQLRTVDKAELTERIGHLPGPTIDTIRRGLDLLFERA